MSSQQGKWAEATRMILAAIDIEAEYERLGVRISKRAKPSATGWLACHSIDRHDKNASASINVGDGPARGRYHDFGGGGESLSLWEFAAVHDGRFRKDWRLARRYYAEQTKIELPDGDEDLAADQFEFFPLTAGMALTWSRKKPGVSAQAIFSAGGRGARWPKSLANSPALQQQLIVFPMFGELLLDGEPTGWHCVKASGDKISIYQGKRDDGQANEPKLLKVMTKGTPGLMNTGGLARLAEANVVWIVEGISDLLATQAALDEAATADPAFAAHVVLSAGAASYHPKSEWLHHFAGKDVRVCFDVDPPESGQAGQKAAGVWCAALLGVADTVRCVKLPFTPSKEPGAKKDLRDYFNSGKTYAELWGFSETFAPLKADSAELAKKFEATLARLGVVVIGQIEGTTAIEVFSSSLNKKTAIKDVSRFDYIAAVRDLGGDIVDQHVDESLEASNGKLSMKDVRKAIAWAGGESWLSKKPAVGLGVWKVDDLLVLVGARAAYTWDGERLTRCDKPVVNGQRLDFGSDDWFDAEELGRLLHLAQDPEWRHDALLEAILLFDQWDNWRYKQTPQLLGGLVLATFVQSIWDFRPQVGILGGSNTGKTTLLQAIEGMLGNLALRCSKPSEAGIRQEIQNTSRVILIDEFEADHNRPKVLHMLRTSSRGDRIVRGTSTQKGASFGLRHIAWAFSVELGLNEQADANRFMVLPLQPLPPNRAPKITMPSPAELHALGQKLLATAIVLAPEALKLADAIKRQPYELDGRTVELYSAPAAMFALASNQSRTEALQRTGLFLREFASEDRRTETDEEALIKDIYHASIMLPGGKRRTIASLIRDEVVESAPGQALNREELLDNVGIKLLTFPKRVFFCHRKVRELLQGTRFRDMAVDQILERLPDAKKGRERMIGQRPYGVTIKMSVIDAIVYGADDEQRPDLGENELNNPENF